VNWYDYIACFFAGMFLANVVPHFVHGISGNRFPTPFAHPRGKGLSSPTVNVAWALVSLVIGYMLLRLGKLTSGDHLAPSSCHFLCGDCCNKLNFEREICHQRSRLTRKPPEPDAHRCRVTSMSLRTSGLARKLTDGGQAPCTTDHEQRSGWRPER
jgi:hypothetical protein